MILFGSSVPRGAPVPPLEPVGSAETIARLENELALAKHNLAEMRKAHDGVMALLAEHQELSRLQGNRNDELLAELGKTQARLRAADTEIVRLNTMLNGFARRPAG